MNGNCLAAIELHPNTVSHQNFCQKPIHVQRDQRYACSIMNAHSGTGRWLEPAWTGKLTTFFPFSVQGKCSSFPNKFTLHLYYLLILSYLCISFLFGACCQLSPSTEIVTASVNKPALSSIEAFNGNDNRVTVNGNYGSSDTILLETSRPIATSTDKTTFYLSSHSPGQVYSSELPTHVTDSFDTATIITTGNKKKKVPSTKPSSQYYTKPTKFGTTDKYVLVQTLSNDKNHQKPGAISENEINSIESIILMLNDTKTGPQYNTDSNLFPSKFGTSAGGNFYITTKLPSSTGGTHNTKQPIYNVTYAQTSIFAQTSTPSTLTSIFEKIPTLQYNGSPTTKLPSTSYVYSTTIPKRPTTISSGGVKISSTSQVTKKPTKTTASVTTITQHVKKPSQTQKVTSKPISTSYVSGPTPARPTFSTSSKRPSLLSSHSTAAVTGTTNKKPSTAPIVNKIGTSTPAPTVIVLGPYGIGSTENPSPTIHITPKPTANYVSSSTNWTPKPDLIKFTPSKVPSTPQYVYNHQHGPIITRLPAQGGQFYTSQGGGVINNDFDDPGYYGAIGSTTPGPLIANIHQTVTSASIYAVVDENGVIASPTPGDHLYTSPNDLNNFPPVRNPNLNGTAQLTGVTIEDYDISTPQFIEDELLNDKMGLLVNKIVESLKDNFHDLADIVENKTLPKRPSPITTVNTQRPLTTLPTKRPQRLPTITATAAATAAPTVTATSSPTRLPSTAAARPTKSPNRRTTKKPPTTNASITKRPVNRLFKLKFVFVRFLSAGKAHKIDSNVDSCVAN